MNVRISHKEIAKRILIFAALVLGTALSVRPLQIALWDQIGKTRDNLIQAAQDATGLRIQYGSTGPSIFGSLDVRNVLVLREDDSVFLSMSRLRLSFSLFDLLRGNTMRAFRAVNIDSPVLSFDFEKDSDLRERFESSIGQGQGQENQPSAQRNGSGLRDFFPERFSIAIRDGEWELSGSLGSVKLQSVGFDASLRHNRFSFQGRWNADASLSAGKGPLSLLSSAPSQDLKAFMAARFSGEYLDDTREGSASVTISSAYGDFFRLMPLSIDCFISGEQLEIRKAYDRSPASFSVVYDRLHDRLQGRFEGNNFSPSSMLVFTGGFTDYNPLLETRITGSAGFERSNSDSIEYFVDLSGAGTGDSLLGQLSLDINITGNPGSLSVDSFNVRSPFGSLRFAGGMELNPAGIAPVAPYGNLHLSDFRLRGNRGISGDIRLESSGNDFNLLSRNLSAGNLTLSALNLGLALEQHGLAFVFSAGKSGEQGSVPGSLFLEGSADYDPRQLRANLRLDSFLVKDVLSLLEPFIHVPAVLSLASTMAEDTMITTEAFFTTDFVHMLYNVPRISVVNDGLWSFLADASISGTDRAMELDSCHISWENGTADLSGFLNYYDTNSMSFSFGAIVQNLAYYFDGHIQDKRSVSIRVSYGLEVSLTARETGTFAGYAKGDNIPFFFGGGLSVLNFLCSIVYDSTSSWRADIERFEITGISTPASSSAVIRLSGAANESGMTISNLFFDDGLGALLGIINLGWDPAYEDFDFNVDISGHNHSESYNLSGAYRDRHLELSLLGEGMQFARFSPQNAVVDGRLRLSWESFSSFDAEANISSFAMQNQGRTLHASANINVDNDLFLTEGLNVSYSGLELTFPQIRIDRSASQASTSARIVGSLAQMPVNISFQGGANFNASETWLDLYREFQFLDASVTVSAAQYSTMIAEEPFAFSVSIRQEDSEYVVDLNGGPRNMLRFRYNSEPDGGIFYAALSAPSPARGTINGSLDSGRIDARTTDLYVDIGALWRFIPPLDFLAFPGGIATASIRVAGTLREPEFYGTVRGTSLRVLVPQYLPEPIRPAPLTVHLNGTEMTFGPVEAMVGRGGGIASGWFRFDRWIPNIFNIDVRVQPDHAIPYDLGIAGLYAGGVTSGRLLLAMEDMIFSVTGDLTAHDTDISLDISEFMAADSGQTGRPGTVTVNADLSIQAGRRVEFFFPSMDFPVLQAFADMGTGIRVTADTSANRFTLTGDVALRGGEIFYLERNFYIREGTLFFRESETHFEPRLTARAEIRDRADVGPVTISMIIDNAPLMSFSPRFVSNPPISQLEIYSLLGQVPQDDGDQRNLAASLVIDSLAQFTVMRRVQRQVRDFLGVDMFSMRTQLFQNVLFQVAGIDPSPFGGQYRVANYFDNSTIFLGKFFGSDIFAEGMITFRYDETRLNWGGMVLEPELALEMRNPLFDIRFNIAPHTPRNLFIDDISISLIWRRTL